MTSPDASTRLAEAILAFRRIRAQELPSGLFSETGWEYLLELFIADTKGDRLTGRIIAARSSASETVALRWLKHLQSEQLVVGDGAEGLDDVLSLSPNGLDRMEELLERGSALGDRLVG